MIMQISWPAIAFQPGMLSKFYKKELVLNRLLFSLFPYFLSQNGSLCF